MTIILFLLLPLILSAVATPLLIFFSKKRKIFDFPEGDILKIHKTPISMLGGLAMFSAVLILFLFLAVLDVRFLYVAAGSLIIFALGIWDDLKWKHITSRKPLIKFFFLVLCSLISSLVLYFCGIRFFLFPFLAPLYIFVFINAVNYQDGIDGQAGILSLVSFVGFLVLSIISGNYFSLIISLAFLGAILGFLSYNFPPAKIFMGDSGAYFLGFGLATLSIFFSTNILSGLFIIGLPLFDGIYSNARRALRGKSIFLGDREHFYDRMINRGFSVRRTLFISASMQMFFVIIGIVLYIISR
jgi:UDP-GlcNAc:undecaprenyl-phosphate GlcNAc-1-phosphate transferase